FIAAVEQEIFHLVNAERRNAGVPELSYSKTMEKYARIKSKDMGDRGYFDHRNPEGELITEMMKRDGVSYKAWAENIGYASSSARGMAMQFMNMWMDSEGHRKNILSTEYTSLGVGISDHGGKVYATQEFYR
ncbi:MAG: CAP domain-containing protein, partial [Clostridium sp.]